MTENKIISAEELSKYGKVDDLNGQAVALVHQQKAAWELAGKNYAALPGVQTRTFDYGDFNVHAHHNPGRLRSSAALTDAHSIAQRPCFLCPQNLPPEQKGILFNNEYLILTNPFPIFPLHLTVSHLNHIPQRLDNHFPAMLDLSKSLPGFTVFYNGPQCGASAPDHFHFQAGARGLLPIENELEMLRRKHSRILFRQREVEVFAVDNYLRRFFAVVSADKQPIIRLFEFFYSSLRADADEEPMMNVLAWHSAGKWHIVLFPREKQRPSHFFYTGENQIVIGPAAVEMGGILILPRQNDYEKMNEKIIAEIYGEITASLSTFELMIEKFGHYK